MPSSAAVSKPFEDPLHFVILHLCINTHSKQIYGYIKQISTTSVQHMATILVPATGFKFTCR